MLNLLDLLLMYVLKWILLLIVLGLASVYLWHKPSRPSKKF